MLLAAAWFVLTRPVPAKYSEDQLSGRVPELAEPKPQLFPDIRIAKPVGWKADEAPTPAAGLTVNRFAEGFDHPRWMLVLPNSDVLLADTRGPKNPNPSLKDRIQGFFMKKAGSDGPSANTIWLLRDADGDGKAEVKTKYLTGLNSPFGMALIGDKLYVANTDELLMFPYKAGDTQITAKGTHVLKLPATAPNYHWTKNLIASPDGSKLYIAVGSNSNIGDGKGGMDNEFWRANILELTLATGKYTVLAAGMRNPVGMAYNPRSGELWAVVNERDQLGPDLVPDYLARPSFGTDFGWPYYYWGGYEDPRSVKNAPEDKRQYTKRPEYALGSHVAPLGLTFAEGQLGAPFTDGAVVALHGSWNRTPPGGFKVVFVKFAANGKPAEAKPVDLLTGFLAADAKTTKGRPTDVKFANDGALLVTDDTAGIIWRIKPIRAQQ